MVPEAERRLSTRKSSTQDRSRRVTALNRTFQRNWSSQVVVYVATQCFSRIINHFSACFNEPMMEPVNKDVKEAVLGKFLLFATAVPRRLILAKVN